MRTNDDIDISQVEGNASPHIKRSLFNVLQFLGTRQVSRPTGELLRTFEAQLLSQLRLTEVSVSPKAEEAEKLEGRVVFEVTPNEETLNAAGNLHGGSIAMLIDSCSTMPIIALGLVTSGRDEPGVSQSLNIVYHSPALKGDKLRIVSTTLTLGSRTLSSRCEIWNATRHRLVASAVHIKMAASDPKASVKL